MSLVKLANGQKFEIETPTGVRDGILHQRERKILPLVFKAGEERFPEIKEAITNPTNTETITIYFPENQKETDTDKMLDGVASEVYEGYTIPGEIKEEPKILEPGTPTTAPVYGRQLTIEVGQRQYGE